MRAPAEDLPCSERLANLRGQYVRDQLASARQLREMATEISVLRAELRDALAALAEIRRYP